MGYDKNGLGFSEICQIQMYFPSVYNCMYNLIGVNDVLVLTTFRKTIDLYNLGLIEREVK